MRVMDKLIELAQRGAGIDDGGYSANAHAYTDLHRLLNRLACVIRPELAKLNDAVRLYSGKRIGAHFRINQSKACAHLLSSDNAGVELVLSVEDFTGRATDLVYTVKKDGAKVIDVSSCPHPFNNTIRKLLLANLQEEYLG